MMQNVIGGLQGILDHAMVGHFVGYTGNAAIGVSWQIFLVVIVFISSLYTGMAVLVARFAGAGRPDKVNRVVYQAFLTSLFMRSGLSRRSATSPRPSCWSWSTPRRTCRPKRCPTSASCSPAASA